MRATFYQVLGIPNNAKIRQIRKAIRFMLKTATLLPSLKDEKDLPESFKTENISNDLLSLAYHASAILLDPKKRYTYDQSINSHTFRNSANHSRYRTLIQYTGGAVRRPFSYHFNVHTSLGKEHLGLLIIGFKGVCSEYWRQTQRLLRLSVAIMLLGLVGAYVWVYWISVLLEKSFEQLLEIIVQISKVSAEIALMIIITLILYKFKGRVGINEEMLPEEDGAIFDSTTWSMLDLSNDWHQEDRIFLGDEPTYEGADWVFAIKMNQIIRSEKKMIAILTPYRRLWARSIDLAFWGCLCLIIPFHFHSLNLTKLTQFPFVATLLWIWITLSTWMLAEAFILSIFNTTVGRSLAGLTLHFRTTSLLPHPYARLKWYFNFLTAFKRSWAVWWYGLAAGFFPLSMWLTKRFLSMTNQRSEAAWDSHADTIVMSHPISPAHTLLGLCWILLAVIAWTGVFFSNS